MRRRRGRRERKKLKEKENEERKRGKGEWGGGYMGNLEDNKEEESLSSLCSCYFSSFLPYSTVREGRGKWWRDWRFSPSPLPSSCPPYHSLFVFRPSPSPFAHPLPHPLAPSPTIINWAALAEAGCLLYSTRSAAATSAAVICFQDSY